MTAAALIPLAMLAIIVLIVVLWVHQLMTARRVEDADDAERAWMEPSSYPVSSPVEPPPAANVVRLPLRLHVVKGGRQ